VTRSVLDDATLARMREEAKAAAGPFVDPALIREAQNILAGIPADWLTRVTGLTLAVRAAQADTGHLRALADQKRAEWDREQRAAAAAGEAAVRAERDEWASLAARLPVPVAVWHNWTARHLDGYEQGADHIVALEDLHVGRLQRAARHPLCWTPSRDHPLRHVTPNVGDENRVPDCKACLRTAERIVATEADR
jgi:crotonobetainyl-CoA:carnitine CoA-transferase CaiB-like acyl-CoA transferase